MYLLHLSGQKFRYVQRHTKGHARCIVGNIQTFIILLKEARFAAGQPSRARIFMRAVVLRSENHDVAEFIVDLSLSTRNSCSIGCVSLAVPERHHTTTDFTACFPVCLTKLTPDEVDIATSLGFMV